MWIVSVGRRMQECMGIWKIYNDVFSPEDSAVRQQREQLVSSQQSNKEERIYFYKKSVIVTLFCYKTLCVCAAV